GRLAPACGADWRAAVGGAQPDEARLAEAVRASTRRVRGSFFDFNRHVGASAPAAETAYPLVQRGPDSDTAAVKRGTKVTQNLPELVSAARGLGYFNFFPDVDGIYPRAPLAVQFGDRVVMPLPLAMLQLYRPARP